MHRGWVKLWRKSMDSKILRNQKLWAVWTWCLMKATHEPIIQKVGFQEIPLAPGQFIFGRKAASAELEISEQSIRTSLDSLRRTQNLTIKTTNKFSIITIVNWEIYQGEENENNQQTNQQLTSNSPATNHKQEHKNIRTEEEKQNTLCDSPSHDANGTEFYLTHRKRKLAGKRLETFNQFWEAFAYKKSRAAAADAWMDIPQLTMSLVTTILEAAKRTAAERPDLIAQGHTPKMAQGWITERRWEDEGIVVPKSAWELRCEQEAELEAN